MDWSGLKATTIEYISALAKKKYKNVDGNMLTMEVYSAIAICTQHIFVCFNKLWFSMALLSEVKQMANRSCIFLLQKHCSTEIIQ